MFWNIPEHITSGPIQEPVAGLTQYAVMGMPFSSKQLLDVIFTSFKNKYALSSAYITETLQAAGFESSCGYLVAYLLLYRYKATSLVL